MLRLKWNQVSKRGAYCRLSSHTFLFFLPEWSDRKGNFRAIADQDGDVGDDEFRTSLEYKGDPFAWRLWDPIHVSSQGCGGIKTVSLHWPLWVFAGPFLALTKKQQRSVIRRSDFVESLLWIKEWLSNEYCSSIASSEPWTNIGSRFQPSTWWGEKWPPLGVSLKDILS